MRRWLDETRPLFEKGGKLEKQYALYEAADAFQFSTGKATQNAPHIRDGYRWIHGASDTDAIVIEKCPPCP